MILPPIERAACRNQTVIDMKRNTFLTWFTVGHLAIDWPIASLWLIVPAAGIAMDLSPTEVGLLFTLFTIGGAFAFLPAGIFADHASHPGRLLIATFWWVAAGYALSAMAPSYWSLALLLAIAGMGNAAWHPIAAGVLTREDPEQRAHALGVHAIGGSFAEVLAPLSVGFLLAMLDWRSTLIVSVVPTVALGICFIWVARAIPVVERKPVSKQDLMNLFDLWRQGNGIRIVVMISLYNMGLIAMMSMIPLYLASEQGFSPGMIGITFSALLIIGAIAQPWIGKISDMVGRRPVLIAGNLVAGVACMALVLQPVLWIMIGAMAIAIASADSIRAAMLAATVDHSDEQEGTTLGLAFVLLEGVGALGAVLAGLAAGVSWPYMFGLAALFSIGAAALATVTVFQRPTLNPSLPKSTN